MVGWRARAPSFYSGSLKNSPDDGASVPALHQDALPIGARSYLICQRVASTLCDQLGHRQAHRGSVRPCGPRGEDPAPETSMLLALFTAHGHHRTRGTANNDIGDAPLDRSPQPTVASRAHDDEIRFQVLG